MSKKKSAANTLPVSNRSAKLTVGKAPCKSCPYRKDVPSGIWAASEYAKLPRYDGTILDQVMTGGSAAIFDCHQQDGNVCAGWIGCHGADNLLALRITTYRLDDSLFYFESPVPLFKSGEEAWLHGTKKIKRPGLKARRMMAVLSRKQKRR